MTDFVEHDDYGESASSHTVSARKIITGLRAADFRKLAAAKEITTDYTAAAYTHRVTEVVDGVVCATTEQPFTPEQTQCIDDAYRSLASRTLLQVDLRVGRGSAARHARLYLPAHHADLDELLKVDVDGWLAEIPSIREHYAKFGDKLPARLSRELDALEQRLQAAK